MSNYSTAGIIQSIPGFCEAVTVHKNKQAAQRWSLYSHHVTGVPLAVCPTPISLRSGTSPRSETDLPLPPKYNRKSSQTSAGLFPLGSEHLACY